MRKFVVGCEWCMHGVHEFPALRHARHACMRPYVVLRLVASTFLLPLHSYCSPGVGILLRKQCSRAYARGVVCMPVLLTLPPSPVTACQHCSRAFPRSARSVLLARPHQQRCSASLALCRCRHAGLAVLPLSVGSGRMVSGQCPVLRALPLWRLPDAHAKVPVRKT